MKLLTFAEFALMPPGTIYREYTDVMFHGGLCKKRETIYGFNNNPIDFYYNDLLISERVNQDGYADPYGEFQVGSQTRCGTFEYDIKYIVYEQQDIRNLINELDNILHRT